MDSEKWSDAKRPVFLRLISRLIDLCLIYLVLIVICIFTTPWIFKNGFYELVPVAVALLISFFMEALGLKLFGTTLGKSLLGLRVFDEKGQKLPYKEALKYAFFNVETAKIFVKKRAPFRRFIAVIVAALLASSVYIGYEAKDFYDMKSNAMFAEKLSDAERTPWHPFDGSFKAEFPSKPTGMTDNLPVPGSSDTIAYEEASAKSPDGEITFNASYIVLKKSWTRWPKGLVLKTGLKLFAKNTGGKIHNTSSRNYMKYPALEYLIKRGKEHSAGRLVLVKQKLYKIEVTYPESKSAEVNEAIDRFLLSFEPKN